MASAIETYLLSVVAQLAVPVTVAPQSTASAGTAAGATETLDAVLGVYQCNLIAGRRYRAVMDGLTGNAGVAGDVYVCNIRNSGSATTPTATSTLVAQSQWTSQQTGSAGRVGIPLANTFVAPASGLNTLAFFAQRISGTGSFTPVSPSVGVRELYVVYLGTV